MARRRGKMRRKARQGPGHNEQNRYTRASRQKAVMLNQAKEAHFRYDVEQILVDTGMVPEVWRPFLQTLWTRGTRAGLDEAKAFLREQAEEGVIDGDTLRKVMRLTERAATVR